MGSVRRFSSQVFKQENVLSESEAEARGGFVRAFMDEHGSVYKAEVVRDGEIIEVVYHGVADEHQAELLATHRAAYPGVPFETVGETTVKEGERQQRTQRYDADAGMIEVVIETLDERGELLVEVRQTPDGTVTSWREYEYDAQGDIVRGREYDGQGRLVDEYEASE